MDLYLHIGTEKTGTTSIQHFMAVNRGRLGKIGICYPASPGSSNHIGLPRAALELGETGSVKANVGRHSEADIRKFRETLMAGLSAELTSKSFSHAVISSEHFSSRLLEERYVSNLRDLLAPFFDRMRIVVYLRRQDEFLISTYSTGVKVGETRPLRAPKGNFRHRYDYWDLLSRWERIFGRENIICRRFEAASLKNGNVVDDFLDAIGIELGPSFHRPGRHNQSLDAECLEFLRLFNRHIPKREHGKLNPVRSNIVGLLHQISHGPLATLPATELERFMAEFRQSNAKVAEAYFGGVRGTSDDPLFAARDEKAPRVRPALTAERAVEISAWLWRRKLAGEKTPPKLDAQGAK